MDINEKNINKMSNAIIDLMNDHAELNNNFEFTTLYDDFNEFIFEIKEMYKIAMFEKKQLNLLKASIPKQESLDFITIYQMEGSPIFDKETYSWLIIEECKNRRIIFHDGSSIDESTYRKGRYYEKWQHFTNEEIIRLKSMRILNIYEESALTIFNIENSQEEKKLHLMKLKKILLTLKDVDQQMKNDTLSFIDDIYENVTDD